MKTKLMIISILTAACIFVLSGATWAESKKDRRNKNPKQKHYVVAKHAKPAVNQSRQWRQANRSQDKKNRYHNGVHPRGKYHHPVSRNRHYGYKPYYGHLDKHSRYYKPRHYIHRPVKKYRRPSLHRPIFSHTDDNVSILATTSRRGWSIKISSRD